MPELPEVETVRRGLAPVLEGAVIREVELRRSGLRLPFPPGLAADLCGRSVLAVGRRAKYLLIELSGGQTLISHLGMSGAWRIEEEPLLQQPALPAGQAGEAAACSGAAAAENGKRQAAAGEADAAVRPASGGIYESGRAGARRPTEKAPAAGHNNGAAADKAALPAAPAVLKHDHVIVHIGRFTPALRPAAAARAFAAGAAGAAAGNPAAAAALVQAFRVSYNDPRRFGFLTLAASAALPEHPLLARLGIEPLGNRLDGAFLQQVFAGKKAPLKAVLLDQHIIAGLGNIYVCEALWRARLSPLRPAADLARRGRRAAEEAASLAAAIRSVLAEALQSGGSHLRNYAKVDGTFGLFQHQFQVYGREGEACRRCGAPIKRQVMSGRSSFYCAQCQK